MTRRRKPIYHPEDVTLKLKAANTISDESKITVSFEALSYYHFDPVRQCIVPPEMFNDESKSMAAKLVVQALIEKKILTPKEVMLIAAHNLK